MNVQGKHLRIVLRPQHEPDVGAAVVSSVDPRGDRFALLDEGGTELATGPSARVLSRRALDAGAREVRFDFDLRHET